MKIESLTNIRVKNWCKLKTKKYRDLTNTFLIEGDHLLNEALKKGIVKEIIALNQKYEIKNIPFYEVTTEIMKKISNQISPSPVMAVCEKLKDKPYGEKICILDNIQDPGNLGTIIRSAVAFNIDTIIVSLDTVDIYNEKVVRASEGMFFHLNIIKKDLKTLIPELKTKQYKIYGTIVDNGTNLKDIRFSPKIAIIIGNEGNGIKENLITSCDELINIPMNKNCESLNAGVCASIIFYEINN